jgi:hypothetical protein
VWKTFDLYLKWRKRRPHAKANSGFNILSNDTLISNGSFAVQPVKCKRGHGGRTSFTPLLTNLVPSTVHCFHSLPNITKATIFRPSYPERSELNAQISQNASLHSVGLERLKKKRKRKK